MTASVTNWFDLADLVHTYERQVPVVLVNGLAEQSESWFAQPHCTFAAVRRESARDSGL